MTNSQSDVLYHFIKNAIAYRVSKVELRLDYSEQDIRSSVRNVMRDNPQFFWYAYHYHYAPDIRTITIHYTFSKEKVDFFKEQIESVIKKDFRIDYVRTLSPVQQICYIYKWLIWYTNYNPESSFNQSIVSVFVKRNSVCTGYAKAAQYLCQILGLESKLVFGRFHHDIEEGRHCWNLVKLNDIWYHLDVCLGDPSVAKKILPNSNKSGLTQDDQILFDNFCVSTEKILETRTVEDIDQLPDCSKCIDSIPDIKLQPTERSSNLGCQVSTVGMTSKVFLSTKDKHKVIKCVEGKGWENLVENERNCYTVLSECRNILKYYGGIHNQIIIEQATPLTDLMQSHYYKPTVNSVLKLLLDIAKAVKYCFDKGFAYRDVHIGNIYRRSDRTWALGDFGHCVPISADNKYSDVVGNPRFLPQTTISSAIFDRSSATYSLIKILEFIMEKYKLSLSNISEIIAYGLKENKSEDSLEALINILANRCEEEPMGLRDNQQDIIVTDEIESSADTCWCFTVNEDCDGKSVESFATSLVYDYNEKNEDIESFAVTDPIDIIDDDLDFDGDLDFIDVNRTSELNRNSNTESGIEYSPSPRYSPTPSPSPSPGCCSSPSRSPSHPTYRKNNAIGFGYRVKRLLGLTFGRSVFGGIGRMYGVIFGRKSEGTKSTYHPNKKINPGNKTEIVNSCVYAPAKVIRYDYMLVQVYMYRDEESDKVRAKAIAIDKSAEIRQYKPLELPIKIGDEVRVHLKMKGTDIEEDTKSFHWTGAFKGCEFSVFIPKDFSYSTILGTVDVFINNLPAGEMIFKTTVVDKVISNSLAEIETRAFDKIFVSYCHKDTKIVRPLVEGLRIANKEYFFDRHTLKGGDKYREEIHKWIDTSDIFVLCWSKNAAESVEVVSEKDYALKVISRDDSRLRLYPISISPEAPLPSDMSDTYNFAQLNP